jgi:hypothetical protein
MTTASAGRASPRGSLRANGEARAGRAIAIDIARELTYKLTQFRKQMSLMQRAVASAPPDAGRITLAACMRLSMRARRNARE